MLLKTIFKINFKSSCKNSLMFFGKVFKKIYTFNFYIFYTKFVSTFMILSFWVCLISNFFFNRINLKYIEKVEKENDFLWGFYLSFQFNLLIELVCSTFYIHPNMNISTLLALGYYFVLNVIIIVIFFWAERKEFLNGAFLLEEPQRVLNIIIFFILLVLKLNCLYKVIKFDKKSKLLIY